MNNPLCIYHSNCADGFTAAWAVWKAIPDAEFYPGSYGDAPPDCTGRNVILVDFTYKRPVLLEIAKQAISVLILDHHKSAEADLIDLPDNVSAHFDMERSGAMMAWEFFHPNKTPSSLVKHVQDRDLWRFRMEDTRDFSANLFSYEYTFDNWEKINSLCADDYKYHQFISEGGAINRKHFKDIRELIATAGTRADIGGYNVPVLNAPYFFSSDACHLMCEGEPFAACYWDTNKGRVYSLRSNNDGVDVSEIAVSFGGGGHKHAAGFTISNSPVQLEEGE